MQNLIGTLTGQTLETSLTRSTTIAVSPAGQASSPVEEAFIGLADELLSGLKDVFPECADTAEVYSVFTSLVRGNPNAQRAFVRRWHELMKPHYAAFKRRDEEELRRTIRAMEEEGARRGAGNPLAWITDPMMLVQKMHLLAKLDDPDFDRESRDNLWVYIESMNNYSNMISQVPSGMMCRIEGIASQIAEKIQSGEMRMQDLIGNPQELTRLGEVVLRDMDASELQEFTNNLEGICDGFGGIQAMMNLTNFGSNLNGLMETLVTMSPAQFGQPSASSE